MLVSVIVPVRSEAGNIRRTLAGLARQDFEATDFEILVVDGQSTDGTADVVRDVRRIMPNLTLLENPQVFSSAARNIGIQKSSGRYVVIIDGHCEVTNPHYLANLVEAFERSGADTLGRPQPLRVERPTPFQQAVGAARQSWLGHNPDSSIFANHEHFVDPDNVAVAYRREVFDTVGLFDEAFDACEDVEFNTRCRLAGLTCYFTPAISVDYQPRGTLRGLAYQMARYGRGRAKLARKHPRTITAPSLVPPAWLLWLALGAMLTALWPTAGIAFAASLGVYGLVVVSESVRIGWRSGWAMARLPMLFAAIHAAFGWGYLKEAARTLLPIPIAVTGLSRVFGPRPRVPARQ